MCERSAKPASLPSEKRCNHLCAVWPLNPYVRHNAATSRRSLASHTSMNFLHSSIDPVALQGILEGSTISPDRFVNHQLASYTCWPACASRWGFEPLPRERFPKAYWRHLDFNPGRCEANW